MSHNPIKSVVNIPPCSKPCNQPRVLITFENGTTMACHDDGSFHEWTGGLG